MRAIFKKNLPIDQTTNFSEAIKKGALSAF